MTNIEKALKLALDAHRGQKDKQGIDYILHPLAVCSKVEGYNAKVVALLHDVLEDSNYTIDFIAEEFGCKISNAIDALTKRQGEDYFYYLMRVRRNRLASYVKIADLEHNSDLRRVYEPEDEFRLAAAKYKEAIKYLNEL